MDINLSTIVKALEGNIRVNTSDNTVEVFNEHGVKAKLHVSQEVLNEFAKAYPSW